MVDGKPADYGPIIKANQAKSTAYLVAASGDCIKGWRLFASKGRHFHKPVGELPGTTPASRSVVGIVVCPGDDLRPVMQWIGKHRITPAERITVIRAPGVDMVAALKPWYEVFDVSPLALELTEWPGDRINKRFGQCGRGR